MSKNNNGSRTKTLSWGKNTSTTSSGVNHGMQDTQQGRHVQQLENSAQTHFGNTGDERFLRYIGDAPSGLESWNLIQNNPDKRWDKSWGGKKLKSKSKRTKKSKKSKKSKKTKRHT